MKSAACVAACLAAVFASASAAATNAVPDSVVVLPEYRVERDRPAATRRRLPTAFVSELRPGASGRALESIADVLGEAAGVRVVQYGGLGAFSTVSIRGATPGHVAVFLDGVPMTSASQGVVNLADLPVTAVERIEVYRGISPLDLGAARPGGAINLVTNAAPGLRELRVTRGSFETWEGRASLGAESGPLSTLLHVGYRGSDGDFRYPDDNGTPFNGFDDSTSTRINNRFDATTVLATLGWRIDSAWRLTARGDFFRKSQGVPGIGVAPASHPRLSFQRSLAHAELERHAEAWWPRVRLTGALNRERSRFRDLQAELGLGFRDTDDVVDSENSSLTVEWPRLPLAASFEATGSLRRERAQLHDAADAFADPPHSRRHAAGIAIGLQLHLGEPLLLHAARRWDRIEDHINTVAVGGRSRARDVTRVLDSPQLGLLARGPFGLEALANWTDANRPPEFVELFGNQGSVFGNPDLVPERGENWDAGLAWTPPLGGRFRPSMQWAHFESRVRDLVIYVRNSPSSVKAQNISRARIDGEELSVRLAWQAGSPRPAAARDGGWRQPREPVHLSLTGSFTWQTALDQGEVPFWNGKRLPQRPGRLAYVRLDGTFGRVRVAVDVHDLGDNYLDRYNRYRVAGRSLVGVSASFAPFSESLRFTIEGKNLGDHQVSDLGGFPLPGRSFFVSCQAGLAPSAHASRGVAP